MVWLALTIGGVSPVDAQTMPEVAPELLQEVVPAATRFGPKGGDPQVYEPSEPIRRRELRPKLALPSSPRTFPRRFADIAQPITVLVGMDLEGVLTGIEILEYRESLMASGVTSSIEAATSDSSQVST